MVSTALGDCVLYWDNKVPAPGLDSQLESFLSRQSTNSSLLSAYVIPTYEISDAETRLPANKTELVRLVKEKRARQFHQALYSINQKSSDLKRWEAIPQVLNVAIVLYCIPC